MTDGTIKINMSTLSWVFRQKKWGGKLLVFALLSYIPVVNYITMGYLMKVMQISLEGQEELPDWSDFGDIALLALQQFVIVMVYSFAIMFPGYFVGLLFILVAIFSKVAGITLSILFFISLIAFVYLMTFVALVQFTKSRGLGDAFAINKVWGVFKKAFGRLLLLALLFLGASSLIVVLFAIPIIALLDYIYLLLLILLVGPLNFWVNSTFFYIGTKICMSVDSEYVENVVEKSVERS